VSFDSLQVAAKSAPQHCGPFSCQMIAASGASIDATFVGAYVK
jgi:hypothetical protein